MRQLLATVMLIIAATGLYAVVFNGEEGAEDALRGYQRTFVERFERSVP